MVVVVGVLLLLSCFIFQFLYEAKLISIAIYFFILSKENKQSFENISFLNFTQDPNLFWDHLKNKDLSWRSSRDLIIRKIFDETLGKIFRRKDFKKIWIKTFSSKNLQKIFIYFLQKNLKKIFLRSYADLRKIFIEDLLKISKRTLNEFFLISRARTASYLRRGS